MKIKKILFTLSIVISYIIFNNTTIFGAGSSDEESSESAKVVDVDFMNGKEQAYNGNYTSAILYLEKSITKYPKNTDAFNMLGYSYRKLGKNEEAFENYNNALELDPKHRGTHEYIGRLYLNLGQLEKAKMHLKNLDEICFFGCKEYFMLKKAIAVYQKSKLVKDY